MLKKKIFSKLLGVIKNLFKIMLAYSKDQAIADKYTQIINKLESKYPH
jgi:hypothetical protein